MVEYEDIVNDAYRSTKHLFDKLEVSEDDALNILRSFAYYVPVSSDSASSIFDRIMSSNDIHRRVYKHWWFGRVRCPGGGWMDSFKNLRKRLKKNHGLG